jgi:hypothetical protein
MLTPGRERCQGGDGARATWPRERRRTSTTTLAGPAGHRHAAGRGTTRQALPSRTGRDLPPHVMWPRVRRRRRAERSCGRQAHERRNRADPWFGARPDRPRAAQRALWPAARSPMRRRHSAAPIHDVRRAGGWRAARSSTRRWCSAASCSPAAGRHHLERAARGRRDGPCRHYRRPPRAARPEHPAARPRRGPHRRARHQRRTHPALHCTAAERDAFAVAVEAGVFAFAAGATRA